jgi:hypothetical protein
MQNGAAVLAAVLILVVLDLLTGVVLYLAAVVVVAEWD